MQHLTPCILRRIIDNQLIIQLKALEQVKNQRIRTRAKRRIAKQKLVSPTTHTHGRHTAVVSLWSVSDAAMLFGCMCGWDVLTSVSVGL